MARQHPKRLLCCETVGGADLCTREPSPSEGALELEGRNGRPRINGLALRAIASLPTIDHGLLEVALMLADRDDGESRRQIPGLPFEWVLRDGHGGQGDILREGLETLPVLDRIGVRCPGQSQDRGKNKCDSFHGAAPYHTVTRG